MKKVPHFTEKTLTDAMGVGDITFTNGKGNWPQEMSGASALITLVLQEFYHPGCEVGGRLVSERILAHLRNVISGGCEPQMYIGPFWANPTFAYTVAIAKKTPTVWSQLTQDEIDRYDCIMRTYAVSINYAANEKNHFLTGPELKGNYNKCWNPNYQSSNLLQIIACVSYFGSAEAVNEILVSFDYDKYIADFRAYHFDNLLANWTDGDAQNGAGFVKRLMEEGSEALTYLDANGDEKTGGHGVGARLPFVYAPKYGGADIPLADVSALFNTQLKVLYADKCQSSIPCTSALTGETKNACIADGKISPFEGEIGMMHEYLSGDAKGSRSDADYCTHNFAIMVSATAAMIALEMWDPEAEEHAVWHAPMHVGNEDHIFRITEGYWSFSHGKLRDKPFVDDPNTVSVFGMTKAIWREFVTDLIHYEKNA